MYSCCSFSGTLFLFYCFNNNYKSSCSTNRVLGSLLLPVHHPLLCSTAQNMNCPISMTAFTLHCKTTAHNSTTTVLKKFSVRQRYYTLDSISTPQYYNIILQHPGQYSIFIRREEFILVREVNLPLRQQTSNKLFISSPAVTT